MFSALKGPEKLMLDQLRSWVKSQGETQQKRGSPWKWVTGLIVGSIALLAVGLMYFRARSQGKRLAKLLHEKDIAKQELERKKVTNMVDVREVAAAREWVRVREAEDKIKALETTITVVRDRKVETNETIDALRNWDDIDRYLERRDG